ncbi:MAG: phosphate signaling complex protein PhoU [Blastochloris sp.]|nr:phosphate signaling complex protein PhoU [Blastochloris sp.]
MDNERIEHLKGLFTGPLLDLKENLLMMAGLTDRNLNLALSALMERDDAKAELVEAEDAIIDRLEVEIDEAVVLYVSTHGPIATECRIAFSVSKISESLERIADQAVAIARRTRQLNRLPESDRSGDYLKMGKLVIGMMRDGIHSFVNVDPERAKEIVGRDKEVDRMNREIEAELHRTMAIDTANIPSYVHLLFISRALERSGDYCKSIGEDVHFLFTAQDIRHEQGFKSS